jgi:hypothetical protein
MSYCTTVLLSLILWHKSKWSVTQQQFEHLGLHIQTRAQEVL